MKLIIEIPENLYKATVNGLDANEIWDLRLAVKNGIPLDDLRAKIEEPLKINEGMHTDSAKAQAIALSWCIEIIDKYRNEVNHEADN